MAPDAKTLYPEGGTKAVSEFESGRAGFESRNFRGLNVVVSEPVRSRAHTRASTRSPCPKA